MGQGSQGLGRKSRLTVVKVVGNVFTKLSSDKKVMGQFPDSSRTTIQFESPVLTGLVG